MRIQANPTALASYGLGLEDVRTALAQANVDQAKGNIDGPSQSFTIGANDQLISSDSYKPIIIAYRNGAPVRLSDVATIFDGTENTKQAAWAGLNPSVILNIQRQPGANIIQVVDRVTALLPQLQASLPATVKVTVLTDRTTTIRASVSDVEFELSSNDRTRGDGDLFISAQSCRDRDSQRRSPAINRWHFWSDVPAGLQPRQPFADGAHDLHRLRGGRRYRDDRKHQADTLRKANRRSKLR